MKYDEGNTFAKIIRRELPCKFFKENEEAMAFFDINPQNSTHILVIPKKFYIDYKDFRSKASPQEIILLDSLVYSIIDGLETYQLITNGGKFQEIPHFHIHILSTEKI